MVCLINDIPIYYEEYGKGKPVLCIHGYWVDHRLMTGCLEPVFTQMQGYRRIYLDLPGMGKTPSADWMKNSDDTHEILKEFINAVIPDENFLIIGESYGGYLTLGLVYEMRERIDGVMLICPVIAQQRGKLPEKTILWKSDTLESVADKEGIADFLDMAVIATPEIYEKYKNDILSGVAVSDTKFLSTKYSGSYSPVFEHNLKTIEFDKPTCILTGRQDHVVGYSDAFEILDRFPRATFAVLDCGGHNLQIENEPLFNQHVKDWIWRVELSIRVDL